MRYRVEQKLSLATRFFIKDESDQVVYEAVGKVMSFGEKISMKSPDGRERAFIKQKLALTPTHQIFMEGELVGTMKRTVFSLSPEYKFLLPDGSVIEVEGSLWGCEYEFLFKGVSIGTISRKWFSWNDTYGVEVRDESKAVLILAMVVALDLSMEAQQSSTSSVASA